MTFRKSFLIFSWLLFHLLIFVIFLLRRPTFPLFLFPLFWFVLFLVNTISFAIHSFSSPVKRKFSGSENNREHCKLCSCSCFPLFLAPFFLSCSLLFPCFLATHLWICLPSPARTTWWWRRGSRASFAELEVVWTHSRAARAGAWRMTLRYNFKWSQFHVMFHFVNDKFWKTTFEISRRSLWFFFVGTLCDFCIL